VDQLFIPGFSGLIVNKSMALVEVCDVKVEHPIHEIINNLFLGSHESRSFVMEKKISLIISIGTQEEQEMYQPLKLVEIIPILIEDNRNVNVISDKTILESLQRVHELVLDKKTKILVHCKQGTSRSVTWMLMFLVKYQGKSLREAHNLIIEKRQPESIPTCPNRGFSAQLLTWEREQGKVDSNSVTSDELRSGKALDSTRS